jgi:hypothetical protein
MTLDNVGFGVAEAGAAIPTIRGRIVTTSVAIIPA